jgi:acyl carrier protein
MLTGEQNMVFEKLRDIICNHFEIDEDSVTMDSEILEDFDGDSLDFVDLSMDIEDEFGVEMPEDAMEKLVTVGDVVDYIENNM